MDVLSVSLDGDNHKPSRMTKVVNECEKSCMECLVCPYNKHSQFHLKLVSLFNSWKDMEQVKWRDVIGWMCGLMK